MTIPINSFQWLPAPFRTGALSNPLTRWDATAELAGRQLTEDVTAELSPLPNYLYRQGLDFNRSRVSSSEGSVEFELHYSVSSTEQLTARGYYAEQTQTLELSFAFKFQQEVSGEDGVEVRTFEGQLLLTLIKVERRSITPYVDQDDILTFLRHLLQEIAELAANDERRSGEVVLTQEDFLKMVKLDNGRLVTKLMALIQMTITQAQMKRLLDGGGNLTPLAPQRKESAGVTAYSYSEQVRQFSLTIREITTKNAANEPAASAASRPESENVTPATAEPVAASSQETPA